MASSDEQFNAGVLGFPSLLRWADASRALPATFSALWAARQQLFLTPPTTLVVGADQWLLQAGYGHVAARASGWHNFRPISGDDEQLWGRLYGTNELRPVPDGPLGAGVDRDVTLRWPRGGPVRMIVNAD